MKNFIGESKYMYYLPYVVDMEKFKKYMEKESGYFEQAFGIDVDKQFTRDIVSFFISYGGIEEGYVIHYHMHPPIDSDELDEMLNPILRNENGKQIVFKTKEECEKFLINLLDNIVFRIDVKHFERIYGDLDKEQKKLEISKRRMKLALLQTNQKFNNPNFK